MSKDNTNNSAEGTSSSAVENTNSSSSMAEAFYGKDAAGGVDVAKDKSEANSNEEKSNESSKTADEAKTDKKEGEESKEGDDKKTIYDDVVLPTDLPEGIEIDQELFSGVKEIAAKHNLPKEALQDLVDAYSKRITNADNILKDQWSEIEQGWVKSAKTDKEIGGEKFEANLSKAKKALDMFGTPALREALDQTRIGNHPELIRMMVKIGEKISEGGAFVKGTSAAQMSASDILFDNKSS